MRQDLPKIFNSQLLDPELEELDVIPEDIPPEETITIPKHVRRFEVGAAEKFTGLALNLIGEERSGGVDEKFPEHAYVEEFIHSLGGTTKHPPNFRTIRESVRMATQQTQNIYAAGALNYGPPQTTSMSTGGGGSYLQQYTTGASYGNTSTAVIAGPGAAAGYYNRGPAGMYQTWPPQQGHWPQVKWGGWGKW